MTIRDFFQKGSPKVKSAETLESAFDLKGTEIESSDYASERGIEKSRFVPDVDYSSASNFAHYGSAEEYYRQSFKRIYQQFPYDGTRAEVTKFDNESTFLDRYIFDKIYPRTTGYAVFSPSGWGTLSSPGTALTGGYGLSDSLEYISVKGGPHTSSGGMIGEDLRSAFGDPKYRTSPSANKYDTDIYSTEELAASGRVGTRESNLRLDLSTGASTEFWIRKGDWITSKTEKEVIFDLWNGEASSSAGYGRVLITLTGSTDGQDPFRVHLASGSSVWDMAFGGSTTTTSSLTNTWNHVGFTFLSSSDDAQLQTKFYLNGDLQESQTTTGKVFGEVTGSLIGFVGALQTSPSGNAFHGTTMAGYGKLSGSIDEFRYWKTKRTSKDIGRNWFTHVGGGTNDHIANTELGVYFKFNEGITTTTSTDSVVLDYSGRISNGKWIGYSSTSRNTGSAIVSASAATTEYPDPIIYSSHPDVTSLMDSYITSGSVWDEQNTSMLYHHFPYFMLEEEEERGDQKHLRNLTQIVGSYFDEMHLQIESLTKLSPSNYVSSSAKPLSMASDLLKSKGFITPEIFDNASILEWLANRDEDRNFELDLEEVKNQIYQNIYNNLININKSKGTEKAFRNLIRCYGVDEDLVKINLYSNNATHLLKDNYRTKAAKKTYADFNALDRFGASVYQQSSSTNPNTADVTYISGSNKHLASTAEIEVVFPRKVSTGEGNQNYFPTSFVSSSIFGCHTAVTAPGNLTWPAAASDFGFQVYAVRTRVESKDAYFVIKDRAGNISLTSDVYEDVYDNQKWNFSVRLKNERHPIGSSVTGSTIQSSSLEFRGINVFSDMVRNDFSLTASLTSSYLTSNRRYYLGSERTNFTGSSVVSSDVRATSLRHWASYLDDSALLIHAKDPENYGSQNPERSTYLTTTLDGTNVPQMETLALNWDFSAVTGSDAAGAFTVDDFSSGSVALRTRYPGDFGAIVGNQYAGRAIGFPASSTDTVVSDYISSARQRLPESLGGLDMINIVTDAEAALPRDERPEDYYFTFEKNMYQTISEEMLNMFGTIVEFNNLIGQPVHKYRHEYKGLSKLRNLFFERIENTPDIDKYIDYYKWIDSSLSEMLRQLVPASADTSEGILNVIESHILERNKYRSKIKMVEDAEADRSLPEGNIRGYEEMNYPWRRGHAPLPDTAATATWTFTDKGNEETTITLTDSGGTSVVFEVDQVGDGLADAGSGNTLLGGGSGFANSAAGMAGALIDAVNASALSITATTGGGATGEVLLTQDVKGEAGNTTITLSNYSNWNANTSATFPTKLTGGSTPQDQNCFWWKERAERGGSTITSGDSNVDSRRNTLRDRQVHHISASAPYLVTDAGVAYESSVYAARALPKIYHVSSVLQKAIQSRKISFVSHKKTYYKGAISFGSTTGLDITDVQSEKGCNDVVDIPSELKKTKKHFTTSGEYDERHAPFSMYSSSVDSGYASTLASDFMSGVDITNNHDDDIMTTNEIPMQGPFTERFVGGSPHRHADINHYDSSKAGTNNLDSYLDRIEGYDLDLSTGKITVRHQEINQPRSSYYRDGTAKRPVNIQNFKQVTGSTTSTVSGTMQAPIGNFSKVYEVVQASDRTTNNSSFVKAEGFGSSSAASIHITSLNDHATPVRPRAEHIIVEKFSSPGDAASSIVDLESGQFSPYNDLNTRNWGVRKPLRDLLAEKTERFGIRSGSTEIEASYDTNASFHKTNRNPIKRKEYASDDSSSIGTVTVYDNWYVQHPIPRSDLQYSWISSSYLSSYEYGHAARDGLYSGSSEGVVPAILFTSASDFGAGLTAGSRRSDNEDDTYDAGSLVRTDFAGLNTTIIEPISASDFRIGYPLAADVYNYYNYGDIGSFALDTVNMGSFIQRIGAPPSDKHPYILPNLIHHRQGPYGWPTWKQIRVGQGVIGRYCRKNNTLAFNVSPGDTRIIRKPNYETVQDRFGALQSYTEPPVTSRNFPLRYILDIKTGQGTVMSEIKSAYGNEVEHFTNSSLNTALHMPIKDGIAYGKMKSLYLYGALGSELSPVTGFRSLTYKQGVYPKAQNSFLLKTRERPDYTNNFWRSSQADRDTLGNSKFSAHTALAGNYSSWDMDADTDFLTAITGTTAGILQNNLTHFHDGTKTNITSSILFHRKHSVASTASVRGRTDPSVTKVTHALPTTLPLGNILIGGGNALWEVGSQAGYYDIDGTYTSAPSYPWSDSYDDYAGELRAHNKDYSVIPEFRISEHIENYIENRDGDFLSPNSSFLSIEGASSDNPKNSSESDFYKVYSNSDFMSKYCVVREDHRGFVDPVEIKLTCKVLKKFIPYNGFYPSELMGELFTRFSSSYMDNVKFTGSDANLAKSQVRMRPFIAPFFAPGIWNNMVKSGIAVDYPIYTASFVVHNPIYSSNAAHKTNYYLLSTSSAGNADGFDLRVPFEAIISPEDYVGNTAMVDMEPHPSASLICTASWDGNGDNLYKMKAHNALASMIEFFLPGNDNKGELATLVSAEEKEWKPFKSGSTYGMRVKLRKSYNQARQERQIATNNYPIPQDSRLDIADGLLSDITLCSRPSSFGPPMGGRVGTYAQDPDSGLHGASFFGALDSVFGANPGWTPSYTDGEAWTDVLYTHDTNTQPSLEYIQSKATTVNWRFDEYALSSSNGGSNRHPYGFGNINNYAMQLPASINVFGKKLMPSVESDAGGNIVSVTYDSTQNQNVWAIQPKMEVPIVNVNRASVTIPTYGSESVPRSVWSQFGTIPTGSEGVYLDVGDIDASWLKNRVPIYANQTTAKDSDLIDAGNFSAYHTTYNTGDVKSLSDHIGFKRKTEKLGQISKSRVVKEAVVAVPFLERDGKREFFEITKEDIKISLENLAKGIEDSSVDSMVSKMKEYIFPPKFDFVKYHDKITPFAMYVFEFKHEFDQDDLSYIWQGIQPLSSKTVQVSESSIKHKLLAKELMGKAIEETGEPLQPELRWMVFKVKQRAATNYYDKVIANQALTPGLSNDIPVGRTTVSETDIPEYSYNWPYDYFSMIESVKIDSEVRFAATTSNQKVRHPDDSVIIQDVGGQPAAYEDPGSPTTDKEKPQKDQSGGKPNTINEGGDGTIDVQDDIDIPGSDSDDFSSGDTKQDKLNKGRVAMKGSVQGAKQGIKKNTIDMDY